MFSDQDYADLMQAVTYRLEYDKLKNPFYVAVMRSCVDDEGNIQSCSLSGIGKTRGDAIADLLLSYHKEYTILSSILADTESDLQGITKVINERNPQLRDYVEEN